MKARSALAVVAFALALVAAGCGDSKPGSGTGGNGTCKPDCPSGQECVGGQCVCDAKSCPTGCCSDGGFCIVTDDQSNMTCGKGGQSCQSCGGNTPTCEAGVCTGACGQAGNGTCANGCCAGGTCTAAGTPTACGATGGACVDCSASQIGHACLGGTSCGCNTSADCPSGLECDPKSHSCSCGPANCENGCCDPASGSCVTASAGACGSKGSMCVACPNGQACVNGACACDPSTCDGCCGPSGCIPAASETTTACGSKGAACMACPSGQECKGGACVCDATSCPNGCCANGVCVPFSSQTPNSCGKGGAACGPCANGQDCAGGSCSCDAASCPSGCCDANGVCQPGNAPNACGSGGKQCATCAGGQGCTGGACACNPTTCPNGCCDSNGVCQTPSATSCGTGGGACAPCAAGQACGAGGSCVCDATSCPNGCCNGNSCVPYNSQTNSSCGTGGAACGVCKDLTPTCAAGACTATCGGAGNGTCTGGCCSSSGCAPGTGDHACGTTSGSCVDCANSAVGHVCRSGVCGCNGNSDCPTGQLCNSASHTCGSCNLSTCPNGCCDNNGQCQTSESPNACGTGGNACSSCGSGQACSGGACVCNAASCPNGCCNGNSCVPYASQGNLSCGTGGASCGPCTGNAAGGACVDGHCGCSGANDCPTGSICSASTSQCIPGGSCSAGACNGCCANGICSDGTAANACGPAGGNCSDCTANVPLCDSGATCTNHACAYTPSGPGTSCSNAYCTVGQTCDGNGSCTGGSARDCSGGNACLSCTCSNASSSCSCNSKTVSAASSLTVTSSCLTLGTGAQLAVVLKLVDSSGAPATGATVTFNSTSAVSWLEPAVVEVAGQPGTYYRTLLAPASGSGTTISASASFCSSTTPITQTRDIHFAPAAPAKGYANAAFQGVAGCSPVAGHVRVKVVAAEDGSPIAGASVLVGASGGTPFVSTAAALFPTPTPSGANFATTNAQGIAEFVDFGTSLAGAPIVTAGAANRAYQTFYHFSGDDQVLALPLRHPVRTTYRYTNVGATPIPTNPSCSTLIQAGFFLEDTTLDQLGVFNLSSLVGPNKCLDLGLLGKKALPENIYLPSQSLACLLPASSAASLTVDAGARVLTMPFVRLSLSAVQSGGPLTDLIQSAQFVNTGYQSKTVNADLANDNITINDTYPNKLTINFANTPANTDVSGVVLADYSGGDGTGALGINGIMIHKYTDTGTSVVVPIGTSAGAPGTRYLGAAVASFLPATNDPRNLPAETINGLTSVVLRDGAAGAPPFGSGASTAVTMNTFLGLAPGAVTGSGTVFTFGDATKGSQTPQYSISTLSINHATWVAQQSCETTPSKTTVTYPQWIVVRPHADDAANCAGLTTVSSNCEAFTLPTLPASFPNAAAGTQQQSGFEAYVGSGVACTSAAQCKLNEVCQVPAGTTMPAQCMGKDASSNFYTEQYLWTLEDRVLSAPTAPTAAAADLTQWRPYLTQESANKINW